MHLSIVTGNPGKYEQLVSTLPDIIIPVQKNIDLPEIQTHMLTTISADKAQQAFSEVGGPVLVDDTGIYFEAFHQFPGALTKFLYKGVGLAGIKNLYTGVENTSAYFQTVLSYMDETRHEPIQFIGEIHGTISFDRLDTAEGDVHLPYDLIFIPKGYETPAFFNMSLRTKGNARIQAGEKFAEWIVSK